MSQAAICSAADATVSPFVLVVDPGHGGKDGGCEGLIDNEKTIVLDVSRRFAAMVSDSLPEVRVVMTRDDNRYITLQERAAIANRANGNVFMSIHVNSVDRRNKNRRNLSGASVYVLGLHKSENNLSVAMRENSVMQLEDDYSETYEGFDPKSSESYIIFELSQNNHLNKSIELADAVQHELIVTAGRADKSVRQAGFWVLWATSMPSVLVELDYICNPDCEKFLHSDEGKDRLALALFRAFSVYYGHHRYDTHGPRTGKSASEVAVVHPYAPSGNEAKKAAVAKTGGVTYHVQILSALKKIPAGDAEIKGVPEVNFFKDGKFYKYYSGSFHSAAEAKKRLATLRKRFPKAFVVKLRDGKPTK